MQRLDYLNVTDVAARKIKEILSNEGAPEAYVRVSLGQGGCGCSGPSYMMSLEREVQDQDIVGESNGVKFALSPPDVEGLRGAEIDYESTINQSGFKLTNPNTKPSGSGSSHGGCGCGHGH